MLEALPTCLHCIQYRLGSGSQFVIDSTIRDFPRIYFNMYGYPITFYSTTWPPEAHLFSRVHCATCGLVRDDVECLGGIIRLKREEDE